MEYILVLHLCVTLPEEIAFTRVSIFSPDVLCNHNVLASGSL